MLTATPGSTPPLLSTALPVMVPVVACPNAGGAAPPIIRAAAATQPRNLQVMVTSEKEKGETRAIYSNFATTIHSAGMKLKKLYSSREVAQLTGLTARQLQWWDKGKLFPSTIPSHMT